MNFPQNNFTDITLRIHFEDVTSFFQTSLLNFGPPVLSKKIFKRRTQDSFPPKKSSKGRKKKEVILVSDHENLKTPYKTPDKLEKKLTDLKESSEKRVKSLELDMEKHQANFYLKKNLFGKKFLNLKKTLEKTKLPYTKPKDKEKNSQATLKDCAIEQNNSFLKLL